MTHKQMKKFMKAEIHTMRRQCSLFHISCSEWIRRYAQSFREIYSIRNLIWR